MKMIDAASNQKEKWALEKKRKAFLEENGFSRNAFKADMEKYYKHFNDNIGANVALHGITAQVWIAFDKVFVDNYKQKGKVHFKKPGELCSVQGYSQKKSGGKEIMFREDRIIWNQQGNRDRKKVKREFLLKLSPDNPYEAEMLKRHVKFVRILRKDGKTKPHWYAQLVLEGKPAVKRDPASGAPKHPIGHGVVGIDIGTRTLAYSTDKEVNLLELADHVQNIEQEKRRLQRKMDRSRRATNPENYNPDGTFKRGVKLTRNKSKRYRRIQHQLAMIQHHQADIRKQQHNELANYLLTLGDCFFVENMSYCDLVHRANKTEISEKTGRYKRKKRFGKSISRRAPARFLLELKQKAEAVGGGYAEVDTKEFKASQYNHVTGNYEKISLSQREKQIGGRIIQRDLYSAFLIYNADPELKHPDIEKCKYEFKKFADKHDQLILSMKKNGLSMRQCFGF